MFMEKKENKYDDSGQKKIESSWMVGVMMNVIRA